jgi:hypothetical protein
MPVPIADGISHWGTTALELAIILGVFLLVIRGQRKLQENAERICREFAFKATIREMVAYYRTHIGRWYSKTGIAELLWFPVAQLSGGRTRSVGHNSLSPLEHLIAQYLYRGRMVKRLYRVLVATIASGAVLYLLNRIGLSLFGSVTWFNNQVQHRGAAGVISAVSLAFMQFLIFWVADAMLLSRSFLLALRKDEPAWPPEALKKEQQALGLPPDQAQLWSNLQLIARRTSWVTKFIWYPCLIIAGMGAAMFTIQFGEVQFVGNPTPLIMSSLMTVAAAILLRRSAESWRSAMIERLQDQRLQLLQGNPPNPDKTAQLDRLLDRVVELHAGAFAPYSEQPLVRAVLVPALTFGATTALQFLHPT